MSRLTDEPHSGVSSFGFGFNKLSRDQAPSGPFHACKYVVGLPGCVLCGKHSQQRDVCLVRCPPWTPHEAGMLIPFLATRRYAELPPWRAWQLCIITALSEGGHDTAVAASGVCLVAAGPPSSVAVSEAQELVSNVEF